MKGLQIEFLKVRRRGIGLVLGALWLIQTAYLFYGTYKVEDIGQGWLMQLYHLPLLNGIMMPTVMAVAASRLIDMEHKGNTWKYLATVQKRGRILHGKMLCGFCYVLAFCVMQMGSAIFAGMMIGYGDKPDLWAYSLYFMETLGISYVVFLLQMILSMRFVNQMVSLSVGLCGSMMGLFLMFVPQWPWLRKILPWGHYGSTMFIGMDWNSVTRISRFYYMDVDKSALFCVLAWLVVLYVIGQKLMKQMEV